ncbi:cation-translocating P-type ATPase [Nocardioides daeguensis]|uniref:Cation-translocating P-type ATPase n=1 Tax=Nocardioides daeguensis TaxID=908359 RepID=A0ABP6UU75_9ACTN|nr:cation-transporting P-type ATPase [Nocardioides daeguensis]MBV6728356.1 cation-transporting P-type ATPase [Nocardioides daeguensis]MCR1773165.1 cation-transporting P-type ATPase [Nocardioides daeguensis]
MTTSGAPVQEGSGLTSTEAARRLDRDGENVVPRAAPRSLVGRVARQLADPMIVLLCGAFVVVLALGDRVDAAIISAVVVLNAAIGVVQEMRAEHAIAVLDELASPQARVRRDGRLVELPAARLVVGDQVRLEAGDVVPADLVLTEAVALEVDEAAMTGESVPVRRDTGEEVLSGTVVTRGRAFAEVVRTGAESGLGRIAALIAATGLRPTPLQRRLSRLSRQLVVITAALAGLVLVLAVLRGAALADSLILAVSLAVAAIPESLPAVVSVALALGALRMSRRSAIVRWLPAVETLGSVSVLASDKTGTLTEGRMTVRRTWTVEGWCDVEGPAYGRGGTVRGDTAQGAAVARLMRDVVLCNDARITADGDSWSGIGDPLEVALLVAAARLDENLLGVAGEWRRVGETPFDSESRSMVTVHQRGTGERLEVVKGAPEVVLELVAASHEAEQAKAEAHAMASEGYRVLAVVDVPDGGPARLAGLVGVIDPPRDDAAAVVSACRAAGIRPLLITGDHAETALAVARQVGIAGPDSEVADGEVVARGDHVARVDHIDVYARTHPEQKVDIIDAWQARGQVVAMTGDGVNDAPALRRADIGVAMGGRGTEVARQAADLVLADDDLRTVVTAVAEGRRIYANIRTFLRYALSGGLAEVLVILLAPFVGIATPLLPGQILWINMLTHGVPGVAFGGEPLDPELMRRPSPSPERSVLGGGLVGRILVGGALIGAVSIAAGLLARAMSWHTTTVVFLTLGLAQLALALALRAPRSTRRLGERALEVSVAVAVALQVLAATWSPLQDLLGTRSLEPRAWAAVLLLAVLPGAVVAVAARRRRRGAAQPASSPGSGAKPGWK